MTHTQANLHNYSSTSTNMVQLIESTINGYKMGPIRALAQEPVQNSKDAKASQCVEVQYRLYAHDNSPTSYVLTVTDRGTKGLGGPILNETQIASRGGVLEEREDWAAFEGHGYTKTNEDALGSRGQGKSAFLYHSEAFSNFPTRSQGRRMVMLYDTLLPNDEYRLGVRYAKPNDVVQNPPFLGTQARELVEGDVFNVDNDLSVPLALEPLDAVGTRVIVPCLNDEATDAIRNGDLEEWLQMCWWRAVQVGDVRITVVDDYGNSRTVAVPDWWKNEPWRDEHNASVVEFKNIELPSYPEFKIKRVVLLHDENIEAHEHLYSNKEPEFDGVQLLRGTQWIETLGTQQEFAAYVPEEFRAGFRGFAEFDRALDRELRKTSYEKPQHDDFIRTKPLVREIITEIRNCVKQFSERQGWTDPEDYQRDASVRENQVAEEFFNTFAKPQKSGTDTDGGNETGKTRWDANLQIDYPNDQTTRVDWGQTVSAVYVECKTNPPLDYGRVKINLELEDPNGDTYEISNEIVELNQDGTASVDFGDFPVLKGKSNAQHLHCPDHGRYLLNATINSVGTNVKRAGRRIFVQTDPPEPPAKLPITASIKVTNLNEPQRVRINAGENFSIEITAKNNTLENVNLLVDASIVARKLPGNLLEGIDAPKSVALSSNMLIPLPGTRAGETPIPVAMVRKTFSLFTDLQQGRQQTDHLVAAPGLHDIRVDMRDANSGNPLLSRSTVIYFEQDPPGKSGSIPFVLKRHEEGQSDVPVQASPSWWLERPAGSDEHIYLYYSARHHLYEVAQRADRGSGRSRRGTTSFIREICADALVDWMHESYSNGDESRYELVTSNAERSHRWRYLSESIESYRYAAERDTPTEELAKLRRIVVANMVRILVEGEA